MKIKWKTQKERYSNGENGYVGKWKSFETYWDSGAPPKNEEGKTMHYCVACSLPGIKSRIGHFLSVDEAKEKAEAILSYWIKYAGLCEEKK